MMQLNAQFWPQIVPRRGYEAPKGADSKEKATILAKTHPQILTEKWFKLAKIAAHTRVRIKRLVITPLRGVIPPLRGGKGAGKPKAERATTKRKTKRNRTP